MHLNGEEQEDIPEEGNQINETQASAMANYMVLCNYIILSFLVPILNFAHYASSHSVITTLPGFQGDLPFFLETGYIGVGENDEIQLFYYFVESERNPEIDPLLLWLTGGPGCSAFSGLVYEIGPLKFNYLESKGNKPVLEVNAYSWTKVANIIFLDAPVGTGFSYATNSKAYDVNDTISSAYIFDFLKKWLKDHCKFVDNSLCIGGDSYSGITVPLVVQHILNGNEIFDEPLMNLKGYLLGNPLTDYEIDFNSNIKFAYQHALLSNQIYESFLENCKGEYKYPDLKNALCMENIKIIDECIAKIYTPQILEPYCSTLSPKPMAWKWNLFSFREYSIDIELQNIPESWCREYDYLYSFTWTNDKLVQKALNIREGTKMEWMRCNYSLSSAYNYNIKSVIDYHHNFTNTGLQALVYSGDNDMVISYVGTTTWIESLNLTISSDWQPWFVDGQVAGYTMQYKNKGYRLTYATVKGGGHTAPQYRPKECLEMLDRWFAYYPL